MFIRIGFSPVSYLVWQEFPPGMKDLVHFPSLQVTKQSPLTAPLLSLSSI